MNSSTLEDDLALLLIRLASHELGDGAGTHVPHVDVVDAENLVSDADGGDEGRARADGVDGGTARGGIDDDAELASGRVHGLRRGRSC